MARGKRNGKAAKPAAAKKKAAEPRKWPVENLSRRPVAELIPYVRNPKLHPAEQVELIAQSMKTYGQAQIILIDEQAEIIAGHGRVLAARQLGWDTLVVGEARGWSEKEKQAYRILDNQLTSSGRWDDQLLRMEIADLHAVDFDLPTLGFEPGYLAALLMPAEDGDINVNAEWQGMPEFSSQKLHGFHALIVHFADEHEMQKFAKLIKRKVDKKTKFLWFPEKARDDAVLRHIAAGSDDELGKLQAGAPSPIDGKR